VACGGGSWHDGRVSRCLYVSDLDGTLLRPDGKLGSRTTEVVNALLAAGGMFAVATARSPHGTRRLVGGLALRLPVIAYGGAMVVDLSTPSRRSTITIPASSVQVVLTAAAARGLQPVLFVDTGGVDRFCWLDRDPSDAVREFVGQPPRSPRAKPVQDWHEVDLSAVFYITLIGTEDELTGLESVPHCSVLVAKNTTDPARCYLELTAETATKGHRVAALKEQTGADQVVVFGDSVNDLSMFAVADESYAVAEAPEQVRARATAVIGSSAEEGVATWLAQRLGAAGHLPTTSPETPMSGLA
jgi:hypothetical protein